MFTSAIFSLYLMIFKGRRTRFHCELRSAFIKCFFLIGWYSCYIHICLKGSSPEAQWVKGGLSVCGIFSDECSGGRLTSAHTVSKIHVGPRTAEIYSIDTKRSPFGTKISRA